MCLRISSVTCRVTVTRLRSSATSCSRAATVVSFTGIAGLPPGVSGLVADRQAVSASRGQPCRQWAPARLGVRRGRMPNAASVACAALRVRQGSRSPQAAHLPVGVPALCAEMAAWAASTTASGVGGSGGSDVLMNGHDTALASLVVSVGSQGTNGIDALLRDGTDGRRSLPGGKLGGRAQGPRLASLLEPTL